MATNLISGGGFSPLQSGVLNNLQIGGQRPQANLNSASQTACGGNNAISYGGSEGTSLDDVLMLVGLAALAQSGGAEQLMCTPTESGATGEVSDGEGAVANASSEKDLTVKPTDDNMTGRPAGDTRSAEEIINDNPVLKNLGDQKDIKRDQLKERFGDWTEDNKDPESRADAAYNMARVLNNIKGLNNYEGGERGEVSQNEKIEGITKDGDARHGTEAGVLKDIAEQGLKMLPDNGNLPETSDTHVRKDGTNKDNFQWGMGEIGKVLSNIPILKSVLAPTFNNIGEARNLGEVFTGGLTGLAEGAMSAARGPVGWAVTAATDTVSIAVENSTKDKKEPPPFS
ncbi:hypothetical protein [Erwinia sp. V71]|uniref:hypothetical protein n=1 Tax=Erwinia sp. V71 TaxID=3369424 RepID=UPI003F62BD70